MQAAVTSFVIRSCEDALTVNSVPSKKQSGSHQDLISQIICEVDWLTLRLYRVAANGILFWY